MFCFSLYAYVHTYVNSLVGFYLKHTDYSMNMILNSNELKEDHNINYSVGFGAWAQFSVKILMHRKLLNSDCSIAYSFLDSGWRENLWAPIQCWSIGLYVWLVSYFLFESFIYLFINYECLVHGFRFCCFTFCMQKMAWIREFLLKFTNFKMKLNLISIIY